MEAAAVIAVAAMFACTGCESVRDFVGGRTVKEKNPVAGPPPPRNPDGFQDNERAWELAEKRDAIGRARLGATRFASSTLSSPDEETPYEVAERAPLMSAAGHDAEYDPVDDDAAFDEAVRAVSAVQSMTEPPRRKRKRSARDASDEFDASPASDIDPFSVGPNELDNEVPRGKKRGTIAAMVNRRPIFAEDIVESRIGKTQLEKIEQEASEAQFREFLAQMCYDQDAINTAIERELLLGEMRKKYPPEQITRIMGSVDDLFTRERLPMMLAMTGATTESELNVKLREQGTDLESIKSTFRNQVMAVQYVQSRSRSRGEPGRRELLRFYDEHRDEYRIPTRARWAEIVLPFDECGGEPTARKRIRRVSAELAAGADFGEMARAHSLGGTAAEDGDKGWIEAGNLASEELETLLFEGPIGAVSKPFKDKTAWRIVKVIDRTPETFKRFEDVQAELKDRYKQEEYSRQAKQLLASLKKNASIDIRLQKPRQRSMPPPQP
jgi:peptidyl-prolyl cis-trans isomerase SurA